MAKNVYIERLKTVKAMATNDPASQQLADIMIDYIKDREESRIGFNAHPDEPLAWPSSEEIAAGIIPARST
jgi:hypothetical protein